LLCVVFFFQAEDGIRDYKVTGVQTCALPISEIDESCAGRGFGSRLAAGALEDARRQELEVIPLCPFVAEYIDRHPEFEDLVPARSEERRVGKECRCAWAAYQEKENNKTTMHY